MLSLLDVIEIFVVVLALHVVAIDELK